VCCVIHIPHELIQVGGHGDVAAAAAAAVVEDDVAAVVPSAVEDATGQPFTDRTPPMSGPIESDNNAEAQKWVHATATSTAVVPATPIKLSHKAATPPQAALPVGAAAGQRALAQLLCACCSQAPEQRPSAAQLAISIADLRW
jgi:hypothetical protein